MFEAPCWLYVGSLPPALGVIWGVANSPPFPGSHEVWNRLWAGLTRSQGLHDPRFPKRQQARINFLADSLAGLGRVTPRSSRDICARERAKERAKSRHKIIRYEFYVECSCGYKGPARDNARPNAAQKFLLHWIRCGATRDCFEKFPPSLVT